MNAQQDIDTIRMLMSLFDVDRSGTINLQEFGGVWSYIRQWQDIFRRFDRDYSGTMDALELQNALTQLGCAYTSATYWNRCNGAGQKLTVGLLKTPCLTTPST